MILNKQNLHTHTTYADGRDTPEELVLEAMAKGFDSLGFSEHSYLRYSPMRQQLFPQDTERYRGEIRALKDAYQGRIDLFCGLELEFYSDIPTDGFDYLIGSVHYLDVDGEICGFDRGRGETEAYIDTHFGGDGLAFARKYFQTVARLPEKGKLDILGHFDLVTKNNEDGRLIDTACKEYLHAGFETIHALRGRIPLFEVNTGAISRGYRTAPYPQLEFLKEFHRCGFGLVLTSDCHDKNYLDCHFDQAAQLARLAGFRSKFILTDTGFQEVAL